MCINETEYDRLYANRPKTSKGRANRAALQSAAAGAHGNFREPLTTVSRWGTATRS